MKAIISHDIDHLTAWEHRTDLLIPKIIIRGLVEYCLGYISLKEVGGRLKTIIFNKWQNLEELMSFNKENDVPSTFFIGVANGNGLNYSLKHAEMWASKIANEAFDLGVHGILSDDIRSIKNEYDIFKRITGYDNFGIRMHYLSFSDSTFDLLDKARYAFDCSIVRMDNPFKVNDLWEFPLQIMDTHIIEKGSRWQSMRLDQCIELTKRIIHDAFEKGLNYFTVLYHDIYFTDSFRTWKEWYIWLIQYFRELNMEFISYRGAVKELESQQSNES